MTDQEVHILLQYLKRHYPEIHNEAMNHVHEFTEFMDNQLRIWMDIRCLDSARSELKTPSLTRLQIDSCDDLTDPVSDWLASPLGKKSKPELLQQLAAKGFI